METQQDTEWVSDPISHQSCWRTPLSHAMQAWSSPSVICSVLTKERPLSCLPQGPLACHYLHCCIVALQPLPGPVMTEEDRTLIPAGSLCACRFDGLVREGQETLGLEAMDAVSKGPLLPPAVSSEGFIHVCGREVAAQSRAYGAKALGSISTPVYRKSQCKGYSPFYTPIQEG